MMKDLINTIIRFLNNLRRPAKKQNTRRLQQRGETAASFIIREATEADIPALSVLHVKTWSETYWTIKDPPAPHAREWQWRKAFSEENDGSWFCYVIENKNKQLVGFAKGKKYAHSDLPDFKGELNKIYLLREYQCLGLGRKLLCHVARHFISMHIHSMVLFGTARNPSCTFHEAMGGKKLFAENGQFHGGYGWQDLQKLLSICNTE